MTVQEIQHEKKAGGFGGDMYRDNATGEIYTVNTCADMRLYVWRSIGGLVCADDIKKVCARCAGDGSCPLWERLAGFKKWGEND